MDKLQELVRFHKLHGDWVLHCFLSKSTKDYPMRFECIGIPSDQSKYQEDVQTITRMVNFYAIPQISPSTSNRNLLFLIPYEETVGKIYSAFDLMHCNRVPDSFWDE